MKVILGIATFWGGFFVIRLIDFLLSDPPLEGTLKRIGGLPHFLIFDPVFAAIAAWICWNAFASTTMRRRLVLTSLLILVNTPLYLVIGLYYAFVRGEYL